MYAAVRRAVNVEGLSQREAARRFGLSRTTVHKMLEFSVPPGYHRQKPVTRPRLDPYRGVIDQILREIKPAPRSNAIAPSASSSVYSKNMAIPVA